MVLRAGRVYSGPDRPPKRSEPRVAANQRPSFLKRQKEQKRVARAAEKREAKRQKKQNRAAGIEEGDDPLLDGDMMDGDGAEETADESAADSADESTGVTTEDR